MIKVYIAAPFGRKSEVRLVRKELEAAGVACTSRWVDNHHASEDLSTELLALEANTDLEDICASDALILLNYPDMVKEGTGGKHFETGYAVALGIPVFVLGKPTSVFHHLPGEVTCEMEMGEIIKSLKERPKEDQ